ncbi:MAG: hypothetical protein ACRELA_19440, partial [Candidatus Rokuibacteriota bacterium]
VMLHGDVKAARVRVAGFDVAPLETHYRVGFDAHWTPSRADLDGLRLRVAGAALQGTVTYAVTARRADAELTGEEVEAADLVRHVAPGWLAPADRLRLSGLRLTGKDVDIVALNAGAVKLEARALRLRRADGEVSGGRTTARADLEGQGITLAADAAAVTTTLPVFRGEAPKLTLSARLDRVGDGGYRPGRAEVAARDAQGRELLAAELRPGPKAGWLAVAARAPALERLQAFWPAQTRRLNGSARLDVDVDSLAFRTTEGRLALKIPEAELVAGKVSVRDFVGDIPVRRGAEVPGEPPWGAIEIGELIGYGLVVRDLTSPARLWKDRLSLNDLTYTLYSGNGKGFTEVEWEPAGLFMRGKLTGERVRVEEFVSAYGIRGGTMTGLLRYDLDYQYRADRLSVNGRFVVPEGGTVNIELLNRLLAYAETDPIGVVRAALQNLRAFDYKSAEAEVRSAGDDIRISLILRGRERFLILPPKVREISIRNMPLSFLARQFPGS